MDALITAGGVPQPEDQLYPFTQGGAKSMLPLAGKPIVQWVLDAVSGCDRIDQVVVVGLVDEGVLQSQKELHFLPSQGDLITNMRAGFLLLEQISPGQPYALLISGDTPGINPEMLAWLIGIVDAEAHEFYYPVVERRLMEARYPGAHRTYARFKDAEVCGGDVMALRKDLARKPLPRIEQLVAARKAPLRQAAILGLDTLLLLLMRQITLAAAVRRVCRRLDLDAVAIPAPYPEMAMDIDKPNQLQMLAQDLTSHPFEDSSS